MAIPGVYNLIAETITTAITAQAFTAIDGLEGMTRATFEATFSGTGGSTAVAVVQSRIGTGGTWREIANIEFSAAGSKSCTVVSTAAAPAAFATLSANSTLNWLGTELRVVGTSTGTWSNSLLSVSAHVT